MQKNMNEEEYIKTKEQLLKLQAVVAKYEGMTHDLASYVDEEPICHITVDDRNLMNIEDATYSYRKWKSDTPWKVFSTLAKFLHRTDGTYYMSTSYPRSNTPYIRERGDHLVPRKYSEMTREQLLISGEMVSEMIRIWNKYYMRVHKSVFYEDRNGLHEVEVKGRKS